MARLPEGAPILGRNQAPVAASFTGLALIVTMAALYVGREIFVPLALAILVSFMLSPAVIRLQKLRVPKSLAVVAVVVLAFGAVAGFGFVVAGQLTQLAVNLPGYQSNIQTKIKDIKVSGGPLFGRVSEMVQELGDEVAKPTEPSAREGVLARPPVSSTDRTADPIPVQIAEPPLTPIQVVESVLGPLIDPVVTFGIVVVFVIFILIQRQDLRDRLIRLVSAGDLNRTTQALEDAGVRVANYLLMQLIVNVSYGIPIGIGLWLIGVPNPVLWGILAAVLRFIPYIGPILAAAFPIGLSIAVDPGWTMFLWTVGLFVAIELLSNNIVEPWLYGSKTGLSPLAIIISAIVWTWLWGPIGLLLSTPLTVCLVVLGRHVPQFAFLDVILGSEPVLTPAESLHQRLLALNPDEATENAEEYLQDHSLEDYYNEVAIPALVAVERDRARGALDDERRNLVVESMLTLIDNLDEVEETPGAANGDDQGTPSPSLIASETSLTQLPDEVVLCIGGRGNIDDAAAAALAQLVERRGFAARTVSWVDVVPANLPRLTIERISTVCIVYLNEGSIAHARYLVRRLRRRMPSTTVLVALLSFSDDEAARENASKTTGADIVSVSFSDVLDQVVVRTPSNGVVTYPGVKALATPRQSTIGKL